MEEAIGREKITHSVTIVTKQDAILDKNLRNRKFEKAEWHSLLCGPGPRPVWPGVKQISST